MNNFTSSITTMFIGSFVIQYFVMSFIMSNDISNITNSIGKFYLSIIMALFMVLFELIMMYANSIYKMGYLYVLLIILIFIFIYLYKYQIFIDDKQYVNEMIEHHSMAILTSKQILQKSKNKEFTDLAKNIIYTQQHEIEKMKGLIA